VASYLAAHAEKLSVATLATISKAHEAREPPNPCRSEIVRATLRGVKRKRGIAQREAKPLLHEDLFQLLDTMGEGAKSARDRALLPIDFAGGFRRSEIPALDCDDVERALQGLVVTLRARRLTRKARAQGRHPLGRNPPLPRPRP
jgi:site-specific recombinase XerC